MSNKRSRSKRAPAPPTSVANELTHFNAQGEAHMVSVGAKPETLRRAVVTSQVSMAPATAKAIAAGKIGKGDVFAVARLAAIASAKRTADLIPLCHPLRLTKVEVDLQLRGNVAAITAIVEAVDRTGVEMEALTAASVAGLTIYDMCKAIDKAMVIGPTMLVEKHGGKSGAWTRS